MNKNTEKCSSTYQGLNQNACGIACVNDSILINDSQIRCKLLLKHKLQMNYCGYVSCTITLTVYLYTWLLNSRKQLENKSYSGSVHFLKFLNS